MGKKKKKKNNSNSDMEIHKEKINGGKDNSFPWAALQSLKPMEVKKKQKEMDKKRHHFEFEINGPSEAKATIEYALMTEILLPSPPTSVLLVFHVDIFRNLASDDSSVREAAVETMVIEFIEVQRAYEQLGKDVEDEGNSQIEAEKDDGLEGCAPLRLLFLGSFEAFLPHRTVQDHGFPWD